MSNKKIVPLGTTLSSKLYITEANESKEQSKKDLNIPDPKSKEEFEEIIANNAYTTKHDGK